MPAIEDLASSQHPFAIRTYAAISLEQSLAGRLQNLYHGLQDKWGAILRQTGHWAFAGVLHDPEQGSGPEGGRGDSGRTAKVKDSRRHAKFGGKLRWILEEGHPLRHQKAERRWTMVHE
jgi:hypothetical protein